MRLSRAPWLVLLALALLAAQAYGQWHRVAHALPQAEASAAVDDHGHHAGDAECRLLDQLSQAEGLAWALPPLPQAGEAPRPAAEALRSARLAPAWRHRARGPPVA